MSRTDLQKEEVNLPVENFKATPEDIPEELSS